MKRIVMTVILAAAFSFNHAAPAATSGLQECPVASSLQKKETKEVLFGTNLHCEACVKKVRENIAFVKGVKDLEVSLEHQTIFIKYDPEKTTEEKLAAAIRKLGYEAKKRNV